MRKNTSCVFFIKFLRVVSLQQVHKRHQLDQIQLHDELEQTLKELDEGSVRAAELAQRFRYYQELRGYVTDLVECLDEKVGSHALTFFSFYLLFLINSLS